MLWPRTREKTPPPLPLLEASTRLEVKPALPPETAKKTRVAKPKAPVEDDNSDRELLRNHLFVAAEAERKLAIAERALRQIVEGAKHPERVAQSALDQIAKR